MTSLYYNGDDVDGDCDDDVVYWLSNIFRFVAMDFSILLIVVIVVC